MKNLIVLVVAILIFFSSNASAQYSLPYHQNFESNINNWSLYSQDTLTKWVWCNLAKQSQFEYSHSGNYCLDINPGTNYSTNAYSEIYTPTFTLDSSPYFILSFWQVIGVIGWNDGMHIQYSTGTFWYELGTAFDPNGVNWYNNYDGIDPGINSWAFGGLEWVKSSYKIYGLHNCNIRFRFIFESDQFSNYYGPRIDDFSLIASSPIDLEPITIKTPIIVPVGSTSDSIDITILNNGYSDAYGFTVTASYDVQSQIIAFSDTVPAADSIKIKIPGFTRIYSADLCITINSVFDSTTVNNQLCRTIRGQLTTPYYQNFDSVFQGWTNSYTNINTQWQLGFPWGAPTNSVHSGTKCYDINLSGNYSNNSQAILETPFIQLDSSPNHWISFWRNNQTESSRDGVRIEYREEGNSAWNTVYSQPFNSYYSRNWHNSILLSTNQEAISGNSSGWIKSMRRISYPNQRLAFRFVFDSDSSGTAAGISIDDFAIYTAYPVDLAASANNTPAYTTVGSLSDSVQVYVRNYGYAYANNFIIRYTYNNQIVSTICTDSVSLSTNGITVKLPGIIAEHVAVLCGEAIYPNDDDPSNNVGCQTILSPYLKTLNYATNFDTASTEWAVVTTGNPNTNWERGMPAYAYTYSTYSGASCWDINLTTSYSDNAETALVSPTFEIIDSLNPILSFMTNYFTYFNNDGVRLEYCKGMYQLNSPNSWHILGQLNDTTAVNWYNSTISGSNIPIWNGFSGGWKSCRYNSLNQLGSGPITFRFVFTSDSSNHYGGFSLDDFKIFYPYNQDVKLKSIVSPINHVHNQNQQLKLELQNAGHDTLYSVPITFSLNNAPLVTLQWNGVLPPDSTIIFNHSILQLSPGSNSILVYADLGQDDNYFNDTLRSTITYSPSVNIPYSNNFDTTSEWTADQSSNNTGWELGIPNFGLTNSSFSPLNCWDINLTSAYTNNVTTSLYSPPFLVEGNTQMDIRFKLNYSTFVSQDGVTLYYSRDSVNWDILGSVNDSAGINWYNTNIINNTYPGWSGTSGGWQQIRYVTDSFATDSVLYLKFTFRSDNGFRKDGVSLDDFQILNKPSQDAGITRIITPHPSNNNVFSPQTISLEIKNWGFLPLTTLQVSYSIDNILQSTTTWNGNLLPDSNLLISFPPQFITAGTHLLRVWITAPGDQFLGNDSLEYFFEIIQPIAIPYLNNFIANGGGFQVQTTGIPTTLWQYGWPNFGSTTGTFSGTGCWDVNLSSAYSNSANSLLISPHFDFSTVTNVHLSFWLKYNTQLNNDGVFLQYSTDDINWFNLGIQNDPSGINWNPTLLYNGTPGWSGNSNGWNYKYINSTQLAGLTMCRLRFVFMSNSTIIGDGVSMDDIAISSVVGIEDNLSSTFHLYPNPATESIHLTKLPSGKNRIEIQDATGRIISQEIKNTENISLPIGSFATGTYLVKVQTENGEVSFKKFLKL